MRVVLTLLLLVSWSAWGEDSAGRSLTMGDRSCGFFIADKQADQWESTATLAWMAGYISAFNRQTRDTYNILGGTDMVSAALWMENYCKQNPLSSLAAGMQNLTAELYPRRHRTRKDAGR